MRALSIGDTAQDNSLVVLDEDRLCYRVRSVSNGGMGVRTISKALLTEWVEAYRTTPDAPSQTVRERLVGKSEIDRFEYGYAGTLAKMAKMILGQIPVSHTNPDYATEFCKWFAVNRGNGNEVTAKKYLSYFKTLTDDYQAPTNSYWRGLYRIMYAHDAEKNVVEIGELSEFSRIYGDIVVALESKVKGRGMTDEGFRRAIDWFWRPEVKSHTCVTSALKAYSNFLEWRKGQLKATNDGAVTSADRLTVALKMFASKRGEPRGEGEESYEKMSNRVREEGTRIDGAYLVGCDYEAFRRKLNDRRVADMYFSQHTEGEKRMLGNFLAGARREPKAMATVLETKPEVKGLGPMTLTGLLMWVQPDVYAMYSEQMFRGVKWLGLAGDAVLPELTADSYGTYKGFQTAIRDRMREMGIGQTVEGGGLADYLTVNEFTWFLSENKEAVLEEVMKRALKPVKSGETLRHGTRKLSEAFAGDGMLKRLAAALRTKPFAILAGHSGTGKSQLVRRLAYMTCNNGRLAKEGEGRTAPGNFCMVQVKPNWHDSSDLLGYYSEMGGRHFVNTPFVEFVCKAYAYPETPFFVCLDEMNLAPVEQYFAEYLSAIESMEKKGDVWVTDPLVEVDGSGEVDGEGRPKVDWDILAQVMKGAASTEAAEWIGAHGVTIPKNLFVVGTVNMDETTCQFSRKVLDRAMTLLMNEVRFGSMAASRKPSEEEVLDEEGLAFFLDGPERGAVGEVESRLLEGLNEPLANTAFVVAYRFANEYALYEEALAKLEGFDRAAAGAEAVKELAARALDHVVLMKLLPRIHGERAAVKAIFEGVKRKDGTEVPGLKGKLPAGGLSAEMMDRILARGDEYLTFWP